jgi:hypothetical protein
MLARWPGRWGETGSLRLPGLLSAGRGGGKPFPVQVQLGLERGGQYLGVGEQGVDGVELACNVHIPMVARYRMVESLESVHTVFAGQGWLAIMVRCPTDRPSCPPTA